MTLQMLHCFFAVADTLSFSRAARNLYISQPAVSKAVSMLEEELGIRLINREVRRTIRLTPAGELLLDTLRNCRDLWNEGMSRLQEMSGQSTIILNLPQGTSLPPEYIRLIDQFSADHVSVSVIIHFVDPDKAGELLAEGELLLIPDSYLKSLGKCFSLRVTPAPIPYYVISARNHPSFSNQDAPDRKELSGVPLLLPKNLSPVMEKKLLSIAHAEIGECSQILRKDNMDVIFLLLQTGAGITIQDGWSSALSNPQLCHWKASASVNYDLCWSQSSASDKNIQAFTEYFRVSGVVKKC